MGFFFLYHKLSPIHRSILLSRYYVEFILKVTNKQFIYLKKREKIVVEIHAI